MAYTAQRQTATSLRQRAARARRMTAEQQRAARNQAPARSRAVRGGTSTRSSRHQDSRSASRSARSASRTSSSSSRASSRTRGARTAGNAQSVQSKASVLLRPVGAVLSALGGLGTGKKVLLVVLASIVLMVGILYPPAQTYYQALRTEQKLQAEYTAVSDRQSYLEQQNKELKTDEGVESRAQEEFGWTKEGESAAIVTNPGETQDRSSALSSQFDPDSIHAPDTWYYKMLDTVFFVQQ